MPLRKRAQSVQEFKMRDVARASKATLGGFASAGVLERRFGERGM